MPHTGTAPASLDANAVSATAPPRVIVVDDDRMTREFLDDLLRARGMTVCSLESGQDALAHVRDDPPDLVLLDVMLPGLDGLDCCRLIKSMTSDGFLPVVLLTARTDPDSRVDGLRSGADDYICKPFDKRELLERVNNMIRIKRMHDHVHEAKARLEQLAIRDELTGLFNYRYLQSRLLEEFKRAERYREPLACVMGDIDHFKRVNDRYGHDIGDAVLREVGDRLSKAVRDIDVVTRYGGEEFLLVLPSTNFAGAVSVAERVRHVIGDEAMTLSGTSQQVTMSLGIGVFPSRDVRNKDELLKAADYALYKAKAAGRDTICVFHDRDDIYET